MSEYETNTANINTEGLFSVCDGIWDERLVNLDKIHYLNKYNVV